MFAEKPLHLRIFPSSVLSGSPSFLVCALTLPNAVCLLACASAATVTLWLIHLVIGQRERGQKVGSTTCPRRNCGVVGQCGLENAVQGGAPPASSAGRSCSREGKGSGPSCPSFPKTESMGYTPVHDPREKVHNVVETAFREKGKNPSTLTVR